MQRVRQEPALIEWRLPSPTISKQEEAGWLAFEINKLMFQKEIRRVRTCRSLYTGESCKQELNTNGGATSAVCRLMFFSIPIITSTLLLLQLPALCLIVLIFS